MSKILIWRRSKPSKENDLKNLLPPQISKHLPRLCMKPVYKSAASDTLSHTGFKVCYIFYFQFGNYNQLNLGYCIDVYSSSFNSTLVISMDEIQRNKILFKQKSQKLLKKPNKTKCSQLYTSVAIIYKPDSVYLSGAFS